MIIEWLLGAASWVASFVLGLFPADAAQDVFGGLSTGISTVVYYSSGLGVWIPWGVIGVAIVGTFGAWVALFALKIVRQIIAHVPFFGGTG